MPTDSLLVAFAPWMRDVAQKMSRLEHDAALDVLTRAEEALHDLDADGWLRHTCMATRAIIHEQRGDRIAALRSYEEAQALGPPASEYMVNQLGMARLLRESGSGSQAALDALECGLSVADQAIPTALALLRMYAQIALENGTTLPLRWSELYLRACAYLSIEPRPFDSKDPQSFTTAVLETPLSAAR